MRGAFAIEKVSFAHYWGESMKKLYLRAFAVALFAIGGVVVQGAPAQAIPGCTVVAQQPTSVGGNTWDGWGHFSCNENQAEMEVTVSISGEGTTGSENGAYCTSCRAVHAVATTTVVAPCATYTGYLGYQPVAAGQRYQPLTSVDNVAYDRSTSRGFVCLQSAS